MRRILAGTFVLALLAVAIAAPPIDYELTCGGELIGVLSLTEGKVHVALVEGASCEAEDGVDVAAPEGAPAIGVTVDWETDPPKVTATATVGEDDAEVVDLVVNLVVVPQVAVDGMVNAQRLRAAAMEMRREASERGETDRDRDRSSWDDEGAPGDGEPGGPPDDAPPGDGPSGPPADVPPGDRPGGPPDDAPRGNGTGEGPSGPPADVPPGDRPGGPPDDAPRGNGTGEGPSGPPADVTPGEGQGPGSRP